MDIGPTPEFRQACREILGADDPATVLGAMKAEDRTAFEAVEELHKQILDAKQYGWPLVPLTKK